MTELRECPFCGSTDIGIYQFGIIPDASVRCESCGSSTDSEYSTVEKAIEAWNTRYEPTCKMLPDTSETAQVFGLDVKCSSCGVGYSSSEVGFYCSNCGARVIEE